MPTKILALKDGTIFEGESFGADISSSGEVVFNTGMMGYPESLTDPSYRGQILVLTYPLIGNYGIPNIDKLESENIHIRGLVVSEYSEKNSHWDSKSSLSEWLKKNKIPAITGIDTRALTQLLRNHGTMLGKIVPDKKSPQKFEDPNKENLVAEVSIKAPLLYKKGPKKIIAIDCGMKKNILRNLLQRDLSVLRVPYNYDFIEAGENFDGVFISNGPGDPAVLTDLHKIIRKCIKLKKPIFGICLGNQILAIASGAKTYKLKFGHRAQNQPVQDVDESSKEYGKCYITSQNHGFAIDEKTLKKDWTVWLKNLNDNTNEGIRHKTLPFFSCQFHPEASPGPTDTTHLFDKFASLL